MCGCLVFIVFSSAAAGSLGCFISMRETWFTSAFD